MIKVLVTGANGFIGKNLVKALSQYGNKFEIHSISRENNVSSKNSQKIHLVDLTNLNFLKQVVMNIDPNIIIHLAYSKQRNEKIGISNQIYLLNLQISSNIIEASRTLKSLKKFIFFGSCDEYGIQKNSFKENQLERPLTSYGLSKLSITKKLKALYLKENYPSVIIRPSVVYGEGQDESMFLPSLANSIRKEKNFKMTMGEQYRDYIYIDDLIEAIILLLNNKNLDLGEIINISYGESYQIKKIAIKLANLIKKDGELLLRMGSIPYRKTEVMNYYTSNQKAKDLLDWYPKTTLEEGLKKIALFFKF